LLGLFHSSHLARGSVDGLLGGGGGVDGGHQTLDNLEVVVDDLGEGRQAVGGAGRVGHDLVAGVVGIEVDSDNKHGSVGTGGGDDHLLGSSLQMRLTTQHSAMNQHCLVNINITGYW
jgi:hypothetical protein